MDIEKLRGITSAIEGLIGSARSLQENVQKQMPEQSVVRWPVEASANSTR
jgi:hypothetical protein